MNAPHPSFLFQADDQIELGRRRAAKAARLCVPSSSSRPSASSSGAASYASLGHPIFLGTKQDDVAELALGGSGADGGREKVLDALLEVHAAGAAGAEGGGRGMWTAESGGMVRRVDLRTGKTTDVVLAHKAPVSSLALLPLAATGQSLLFSSGWDKVIHIHLIVPLSSSDKIPASPRRLRPLLTIPAASTDFIKALEVLPEQGVLLSGGSEKVIRIWDLRPLIAWARVGQDKREGEAPVPRSIGSFGEHTRGITCITSLPPPPPTTSTSASGSAPVNTSGELPTTTTIYSADSMGRIFQLSLDLGERTSSTANSDSNSSSNGSSALPPRARLFIQRELRGPETAVSDLHAGWDVQREEVDDDDDDDGRPIPTPGALVRAQVWIASNDKTVQLFVPFERDTRASTSKRLPPKTSASASSAPLSRTSKVGAALGSQTPLAPILAIRHPDYVKSVLPLATAAATRGAGLPASVVVSGSADEDMRVWKVAGLGDDGEDAEEGEDDEDEEPAGLASRGQPQRSPARLLRRQEGHWHEVEKLLLWRGSLITPTSPASAPQGEVKSDSKEEEHKEGEEWHIISASLDGSIRRWPLAQLLKPQSEAERALIQGADAPSGSVNGDAGVGAPGASAPSSVATAAATQIQSGSGAAAAAQSAKKGPSGMTAEEERELEELMGSDLDE